MVTMEKQLKHLLQVYDSPFERDPNFAFIFYNVLQKRKAVETANFRIKQSKLEQVASSLRSISTSDLDELIALYNKDQHYKPESDEHRQIVRTFESLNISCKDLPGTSAFKQARRN